MASLLKNCAPDDRRHAVRHGILSLVLGLFGTLMLLWPAIINEGPFFYTDTTGYVRVADAAAFKLMGIETAWTEKLKTDFNLQKPEIDPDPASSKPESRAPLAGRSIFYGVFLYLSYIIGSFWIAIAAQALIAVYLIHTMADAFLPGDLDQSTRFWLKLLVIGFCALFTPLAFFVCFLMPDVFAGFGIAAIVLISVRGLQIRTLPFFGLAVLLGASTLVHTSNLLLLVVAIPIVALARVIRAPIASRSLIVLPLIAVLGFGAEFAFYRAVQATTGHPPVRPPFALARMIELGPGHRFLVERCPDPSLTILCTFLPKLPMENSVFLWSSDPGNGLFWTLKPPQQRELVEEQKVVLRGVLTQFPLELLKVAIPTTLTMLTNVSLEDFNSGKQRQDAFSSTVPESIAKTIKGRPDFVEQSPTRQIQFAIYAVFYTSIVICIALGVACLRNPKQLNRAACAILVGCMLTLTNAAIAGNISGYYARLNSRAAWVVPVLLFCFLLQHIMRRPQGILLRARNSEASG